MIRVAIDGPSGAGKSTLARCAAAKLGYLYVDTGAIYRTVSYYVHTHGLDPKDEPAVRACLPQIHVQLSYGGDGAQRMILNGEDVSQAIRLPEISLYTSHVSAHPCVRAFLLEMQREIAAGQSVIMDGRDIGTVVLPEAEVKIFLTASPEARAKRRMRELEQKGTPRSYEEVLRDIQQRDWNDIHRDVSPLRQAEDAVVLDTTELNFQESEEALLEIIRERSGQ